VLKVLAVALLLAVVYADLAPLLHTDGKDVIPGSYIVILNDGLGALDRDAHIRALEARISEVGAEDSSIGARYFFGTFNGFAARLNKQILQEQLNHTNVKYIEADQVMSINYERPDVGSPEAIVTQSGSTWGISRTCRRDLPYGSTYMYNSNAGSTATVYVIDTGILTTHSDFGGRAAFSFNAITSEGNTDGNGHGTHCAGTIGGTTYGIAKSVQLRAVKVLSASGSGSTAGVIQGVNFVANAAGTKKVASMSLGGGASTAMDDAINSCISAGVVVVVAAGNDNGNACNGSPSRVPAAITVGATANTDARSSFSNFGTCVDVFAPGTSITSDWIGSNTATNTISGTSMATPHVAGVAALVLGQGITSGHANVKNWIIQNSTPNKVTNPGAGSPNRLLFSAPTA